MFKKYVGPFTIGIFLTLAGCEQSPQEIALLNAQDYLDKNYPTESQISVSCLGGTPTSICTVTIPSQTFALECDSKTLEGTCRNKEGDKRDI